MFFIVSWLTPPTPFDESGLAVKNKDNKTKHNAIICAAVIAEDGRVVKGHRHLDTVMINRIKYEGWDIEDFGKGRKMQGFIDMYGNYVDRVQAAKIFVENGQFDADAQHHIDNNKEDRRRYKGHTDGKGDLFSENLY